VAAAIVIGVLAVTTIDATRDRDDAQQLAHTIAAPDARTVELTGDVGRGRLVWSAEKDRAVLVLDDLPAVASGRAYELWYIRDGTPEPAGVFRPDDGRVVKVVDALPAGTSAVGVTEEPASGSTSPTGPIMLSGHAPGT
jgi:anti-sigma-K factor RskA